MIWDLLVSVIMFFVKRVMVFYPGYSTFLANSQLTTNIHWPCCCTGHVYVVIHFWVDMRSFWMEANLCRLFIICLYMYCLWRSIYQEGGVVIPLTGLALPYFCACPKLIPVEYILPSLFKVLSCTKTTVGQMNQEPRNILTWCNLNMKWVILIMDLPNTIPTVGFQLAQ